MSSKNAKRPSRIFLVGFMGSGKTTVGEALANELDYGFIDLDVLIESGVGKSIAEIFAESGEAEFRRLERETISRCSRLERAVIALGGGAYVAEENRRVLRQLGITVWLDCPIEVCLRRVGHDPSRPLLSNRDQMERLLAERRPFYQQADFIFQMSDRSADELAIEIAALLGFGE